MQKRQPSTEYGGSSHMPSTSKLENYSPITPVNNLIKELDERSSQLWPEWAARFHKRRRNKEETFQASTSSTDAKRKPRPTFASTIRPANQRDQQPFNDHDDFIDSYLSPTPARVSVNNAPPEEQHNLPREADQCDNDDTTELPYTSDRQDTNVAEDAAVVDALQQQLTEIAQRLQYLASSTAKRHRNTHTSLQSSLTTSHRGEPTQSPRKHTDEAATPSFLRSSISTPDHWLPSNAGDDADVSKSGTLAGRLARAERLIRRLRSERDRNLFTIQQLTSEVSRLQSKIERLRSDAAQWGRLRQDFEALSVSFRQSEAARRRQREYIEVLRKEIETMRQQEREAKLRQRCIRADNAGSEPTNREVDREANRRKVPFGSPKRTAAARNTTQAGRSSTGARKGPWR